MVVVVILLSTSAEWRWGHVSWEAQPAQLAAILVKGSDAHFYVISLSDGRAPGEPGRFGSCGWSREGRGGGCRVREVEVRHGGGGRGRGALPPTRG